MIKLNLFRLGNLVIMKVLEQDEKYRCSYDYDDDDDLIFFTNSKNFSLRSCDRPELCYDCIYIRGAIDKFDNNYNVIDFETENEAIKYIEEVNQLVKEFNKSNTDQIIIISSMGVMS